MVGSTTFPTKFVNDAFCGKTVPGVQISSKGAEDSNDVIDHAYIYQIRSLLYYHHYNLRLVIII